VSSLVTSRLRRSRNWHGWARSPNSGAARRCSTSPKMLTQKTMSTFDADEHLLAIVGPFGDLIAFSVGRFGGSRPDAWRLLAKSDADIAMLQEASKPPSDVAAKFDVDPDPWLTGANQRWRTAIVKLSTRAEVQWIEAKLLADAHGSELGVSRPGTLAAALVTPHMGEPFIAISAYGSWEASHPMANANFIYADASVHRLISDLSVFVSKRAAKSVLVAGDLQHTLRLRRAR
jgi:hypothetical protein